MISTMKTGFLRLLATGLALAGLLSVRAAAAQDTAESAPAEEAYEYDYTADTDPSAVNDFEDRLEPYGTWVYDETYGYVWVPDTVVVGRNFAPYRTAGHWAVLDDGSWVWVSDYEWGYIPFHYGRWVWVADRGWAWIPGRVYAPAWVVWRVGEPGYAYVGWAPAPPTYIWVNGVAVGFYHTVTVPWWYCPSSYFFSPYWHVHIVHDPVHVHHIHRHTHVYHHHHHGRTGASAHRGRTGATASAGPTSGGTPKSGSGKFSISKIPRSPSFQAAHIPKSAIPKQRVKPNSRAMQVRKPTAQLRQSSLKAKRAMGNSRVGTAGRDFRGGSRAVPNRARSQPSRMAPSRVAPSRAAPSRGFDRGRSRIAPSRVPPSRVAPSRIGPSQRGPSRVAPPPRQAPSRSAPRYRSPPSRSRDRGSSGSFSPPSRSRSSFSRPSPGPSRPSVRPMPSRSAPRMSPSRGSSRGGGRRR